MYPIIEIPSDASESPEQVGTKEKFWYADHMRMLKLGRAGTGEHWAEKISCELCGLLGLPHATYDFARWRGHLGVSTDNFVLRPGRLVLGNELLASFVAGYDGTQRYRARQHTVGRVIAAIGVELAIAPPIGVPAGFPLATPKDFLAGYILLDAWIGNTDRHHENWGLVVTAEGKHLAPTFDHASSLGRELSDEERLERLQTRDVRRAVSHYASRARSGFYRTESDERALSTLDAFREVARRAPDGALYWKDRLRNVTPGQIDLILADIPNEAMSSPARQFARHMLLENQRRICSDE